MPFIQTQLLPTILGFSALIVGLSIFCQIIQEFWKNLTSSKSRAYQKALVDFLGSWVQVSQIKFNLKTRGPFQWLKLKPKGILLPLDKEQLVESLTETSSAYVLRTYKALKKENTFQEGKPDSPSMDWKGFIEELGKVEKGMSGYMSAFKITKWLEIWGHKSEIESKDQKDQVQLGRITTPQQMNAKQMLISFREEFLPHVVEAENTYKQFNNNFEYSYKRRNLKQTFFIAIIICIIFNFTVSKLFNWATSLSLEQATNLAESVNNLSKSMNENKSGEIISGEINVDWFLEELKSQSSTIHELLLKNIGLTKEKLSKDNLSDLKLKNGLNELISKPDLYKKIQDVNNKKKPGLEALIDEASKLPGKDTITMDMKKINSAMIRKVFEGGINDLPGAILKELKKILEINAKEDEKYLSISGIFKKMVKNMTSKSRNALISVIFYILECLVTALLISFGAPLFNDITSLILRLQKQKNQGQKAGIGS